jgi:hypothetical protein
MQSGPGPQLGHDQMAQWFDKQAVSSSFLFHFYQKYECGQSLNKATTLFIALETHSLDYPDSRRRRSCTSHHCLPVEYPNQ